MPKIFHIPGIIFLFCAFVLLFLVSVSLPYITALDFARVHFSSGSPTVGDDANPINELRVRSCPSHQPIQFTAAYHGVHIHSSVAGEYTLNAS